MKKFFINVFLWIYIKIHTALFNLGWAMEDAAMTNLDVDEKKKFNKRWIRSQLLQKFEQGQRDEKYVQDYYELLKKADKFMRTATPHQMAVAADKNAMNVGRKDRHGRSLDHVGFFNEGHKNAGKTMGEVLDAEMRERRTTDDDYELLSIFNNTPIEVGLSQIDDVVDDEFKVNDLIEKSKTLKFPMSVNRDKDALNKLEQLTAFLHIKKIGFEHRQLECFIPTKFKIKDLDVESDIFKQIINITSIYLHDNYNELIGYTIIDYTKLLSIEHYDVLKFHAIEMQTITN